MKVIHLLVAVLTVVAVGGYFLLARSPDFLPSWYFIAWTSLILVYVLGKLLPLDKNPKLAAALQLSAKTFPVFAAACSVFASKSYIGAIGLAAIMCALSEYSSLKMRQLAERQGQ